MGPAFMIKDMTPNLVNRRPIVTPGFGVVII